MQVASQPHPQPHLYALFRPIAGPTLLLVIVLAFYWKLTLTNQYTWLDSPDMAYQVLPWFQFQAAAWHSGQLPLWDPYEWAGQPLVGQAQPGAVYPLNWLLFLLPLRQGFVKVPYLHWYFVLIHYMGALFCYLLCRDLQRSVPASLLGGIGFGLAGWMGTTDWPQMLNGAVWAPLVFLFLFRVIRGEQPFRSAVLAGGFLGISFLSGHHQIPTFVTVFALFTWVYAIFRNRSLNLARLRAFALFLLLLLLCSAFQVIPAWEYGHRAVRWVGADHPLGWQERVPYYVHQEYGFFPLSVLGLVVPGIHRHANGFIGFVLGALAFLGAALAWREKAVPFFGAVAAGGLIFALASYSFVHGVIYTLVPMVEKARSPSMAIVLFNFGVAVLAAHGLDYFGRSEWVSRLTRVLLGIGTFLFGVLLTFTMIKVTWALDVDRIALVALTSLLLAGVLYVWQRGVIGAGAAAVLVILLSLTEITQVNGYAFQDRRKVDSYLKKIPATDNIARHIKTLNPPVRLRVNDEDIPFNFGDWYGLEVFGGYLASLTENINRTQGPVEVLRLFGVNYHVSRKPVSPSLQPVHSEPDGFTLYRDPAALPAAWSVHQVNGLAEFPKNYVPAIAEPLRQTFVIGKAPTVDACEGDSIRLTGKQLNRVTLEADMRCRGMVNLSDTWFPGWKATVDGRETPVYETYGVLRGVVVDAGRHRIEFTYRPATVLWGGLLTFAGLLGMLAAARFVRA